MPSKTDKTITVEEVIKQLQAGGALPAELLEVFAEEAEDHLQTIYDGLNRLKASNGDAEALADVRRASHTLKGAAAAVNLQAATRLAHRMEDLLDQLAENQQGATKQQVRLLLTTADHLQALTSGEVDVEPVAKQLVELYEAYATEMSLVRTSPKDAEVSPPAAEIETTETESEIVTSSKTSESEKAGAAADMNRSTQFLRVPLDRLDELSRLIGESIVNRSAIQERLNEFESRIEEMQTSLSRLSAATQEIDRDYNFNALNSQVLNRANQRAVCAMSMASDMPNGSAYEFDSLEFDQYTDFHLLAHTLSEANNDAETVAGELRNLRESFETLLTRQERLNRDMQQSLMHVRMVPLSGIVSRLERTVRTVSNKLGRDVEFEVVGQQTELDKTVLDKITDPLLHLIRNAIDHGIEAPEIRAAAGKPLPALLKIEAVNQGTQVTIRIRDDGAGINLEKVRQKAVQQQLISEDQELSNEELHGLIFTPGFSTAAALTDVSGRGVGMDVVCDTVQRLKGTIRVNSEPGKGTTFIIQLPTTLGVARALIVQAKGHTFAVPIQAVPQIGRLDPSAVYRKGSKPMVDLSGKAYQLRDLATHLQLVAQCETSAFDVAAPLMIVRDGDEDVAIIIDVIKGCRDIVIKALGDHLKSVPGVIGATLSSDGAVVPILDPVDLVGQNNSGLHSAMIRYHAESPAAPRRNTAMVIDDSISVRRVTTNLLTAAGWEVVSAKDGVDALEKLSDFETSPDIFLCDMEMPRMDGIELVKQIRKQKEFEMTPIVMVTSRSSEKHRHKAFDAGATDYVVKPYNDDQLLELITELVQSVRETVSS